MSYQISVYKIVNTFDSEIYIGSTKNILTQRMASHRSLMKKKPQWKLYKKMDELGVDNFRIILIQTYMVNNRSEQYQKEQIHQDELNPILNQKCTYSTPEDRKAKRKIYDDAHRDIIRQRDLDRAAERKAKRDAEPQINCECGGTYHNYNKAKHFKNKKHLRHLNLISPQNI